MKNRITIIDPYLFERHYEAFKTFVEDQSQIQFNSFTSNPFTFDQEGYKSRIYTLAREKLNFQAWEKSDIGKGDILSSAIEAIELKHNNLVPWQSRFGEEARPHHSFYRMREINSQRKIIERLLFKLYYTNNDTETFELFIDAIGKKYSLIAYLFFLKDKSKYLPIAPSHFDRAFDLLGADIKTSQQCSWNNYSTYLKAISEVKSLLLDKPINEVSLLDAHSFLWMLVNHMKQSEKLPNVSEYKGLSSTEREAIIKARIGQGQFRNSLISYWGCCAITGCTELSVLRASHIKPWSQSNISERMSLYNGILLSPNFDVCFDNGLISFDDSGTILISKYLDDKNLRTLGIHKDIRLSTIEDKHKKYLQYHREYIFEKES